MRDQKLGQMGKRGSFVHLLRQSPVACLQLSTWACRAINLMRWRCHIPGKPKTDWEGGYFPLTIEFSEDYPSKPHKVV